MNQKAIEASLDRLRVPAIEACENAHAPYSRFPVGAALATDEGAVYSGCNVENASFGLTICAERNALARAVAAGVLPGQVRELLIYTPGAVAHSPCGACRQVMYELLDAGAIVVSCCDGDETRAWTIDELIPDPFEL